MKLPLPEIVRVTLVVSALLVSSAASACGPDRSAFARSAFKRSHVCPADHKYKLAHEGCSGYVIDHIKPLCLGGRDHPDNMQWQAVADAAKKDVEERAACAAARKLKK